jgi:hypothetical protein
MKQQREKKCRVEDERRVNKSKEKGDIKPHDNEKYTTNFSCAEQKEREARTTPYSPPRSIRPYAYAKPTLLLNLGQYLRILEKVVFLMKKTPNQPFPPPQ